MTDLKEIIKDESKVKMIAKRAFEIVDVNHSGDISLDELEKIMKEMAKHIGIEAPSNKDIKKAFQLIDKKKDNLISLDEFTDIVREMLFLMANEQ